MTNKVHTIQSNRHTIKLDNNTWQDIKKFIGDNYSRLSINIVTDNDNQNFTDFDRAGEFIVEACNHIKKIGLYAQENDEDLKIDYTNGIWTKRTAMYAQANSAITNENKVKAFLFKLQNTAKPEYIDLYNYLLPTAYLLMLFSNIFNWFKGLDTSVVMLITVLPIVIFGAVYNEMAWGRKRIIFWLDENKKNEDIKMFKRIRAVMYICYAVTLVFMVGSIFF